MELRKANTVVADLTRIIGPYCRRFHIAGSVRRMVWQVKDIEVVLLPHMIQQQAPTLFAETVETVRVLDPQFVRAFQKLGVPTVGKLEPKARFIKIPYTSFYGKINLDVFIPSEEDYFRQLCIRTGSRDFVFKYIAAGWRKLGWCGTDDGLRKMSDCQNINEGKLDGQGVRRKPKWVCVAEKPELPPVWKSEEDFFDFIRIKYIHPKQREYGGQ